MEIRLATVDDAQSIYDIEQQSFSVPWSLESVLAELEGADNSYIWSFVKMSILWAMLVLGSYTMKDRLRILLFYLPPVVRDMAQNLLNN